MAWLKKRGGVYQICWLESGLERRRSTGFSLKSCAEQARSEFERHQQRGEADLLDKYADSKAKALSAHFDDYLADLRAKGRSAMYVYNAGKRLAKLADGCGWTRWPDITADRFCVWRETPIAQRQALSDDGKIGATTANQYLEIARTFCGWMVKRERMPANPLASVEKMSEADKRRERRALTEDEVDRLLAAAGDDALCYRFILVTGLRRNEVEQLQWGDFHFDALPNPYIALRAATTKSKRADTQALRQDVAKLLKEAKGEAQDSARVFAHVPTMERHRDILEAAGIEYDGEAGLVDFHSLRHTFGTSLSKAGVTPRIAMELMRHTDMRLTMKVYTDPRVFDLAGAVESLPAMAVAAQAQQATGTDGKMVHPNMSKPGQAGVPVKCTLSAVKSWQNVSGTVRGDGEPKTLKAPVNTGAFQSLSASVRDGDEAGELGFEPTPDGASDAVVTAQGEKVYPKSVPCEESKRVRDCPKLPADLAEVAAAWDTLPAAIRAAIVGLVKSQR